MRARETVRGINCSEVEIPRMEKSSIRQEYKVGRGRGRRGEAGEAAAGTSSGLKPEQRILRYTRWNPIKSFKPGWDRIRFVF